MKKDLPVVGLFGRYDQGIIHAEIDDKKKGLSLLGPGIDAFYGFVAIHRGIKIHLKICVQAYFQQKLQRCFKINAQVF